MSKYSGHSSKFEDLYRMIDCKELKTSGKQNLFDFYISLTTGVVKARKAFYIYVSPCEVGRKASKLLMGYTYPNLKIGVIPRLSEINRVVSKILLQLS